LVEDLKEDKSDRQSNLLGLLINLTSETSNALEEVYINV
jgi:hypothetical protein